MSRTRDRRGKRTSPPLPSATIITNNNNNNNHNYCQDRARSPVRSRPKRQWYYPLAIIIVQMREEPIVFSFFFFPLLLYARGVRKTMFLVLFITADFHALRTRWCALRDVPARTAPECFYRIRNCKCAATRCMISENIPWNWRVLSFLLRSLLLLNTTQRVIMGKRKQNFF